MGRHVFKLPDVGEGVAEAEIVKWHVAVGDEVNEEQLLVDIMTDKATVEIASPVSGRIVTRNGTEGSKLAVGSVLAVFETAADNVAAIAVTLPVPVETARPTAPVKPAGKVQAAPAIRARAKALGLDLSKIIGSGPDGQVQHQDLDAILQTKQGSQPFAAGPAMAPSGRCARSEAGSDARRWTAVASGETRLDVRPSKSAWPHRRG